MQGGEQRKMESSINLNKKKYSVDCDYIEFPEQDAVGTDVLRSSVWGYDL